MPNVEIHGFCSFDGNNDPHLNMEAWQLRRTIVRRVKHLPLAKNMVVTVFASTCFNVQNDSQPFIRIVSTDVSDFMHLVEMLWELIDIEIPQIFYFNEKGKKPDFDELRAKCGLSSVRRSEK